MSNQNNNQFYNDIEKKIKDSLSRGLDTGDFSGLNSAISDSVKGVIKEASSTVSSSLKEASSTVSSSIRGASVEIADSLKNAGPHYGYKKPHSTLEESRAYTEELKAKRLERENKKKMSATTSPSNSTALRVNERALPVNFVPVGSTSSTVCMITGAVGMVGTGFVTAVNAVATLASSTHLPSLIVSSAFLAGSGILFRYGLSSKETLNRAKRYAQVCGSNMYAQISSLASAVGVKSKKVKKDLKRMLQKGYFPQGYIDDEETTFMISTDVYKQYQQTKQYSLSATAGSIAGDLSTPSSEKAKEAKERLNPAQRAELDAMIAEGREYIAKLHVLNAAIPGESITNKLNELESVLNEIFTRVELYPEQMGRMHKLMEYYLPTMIKLVEAYEEYDKVSSPGEEIIQAKAEIENTLDTINEAFVQLLNNLFQDSVWDVTSDAQVLQTMLKQEGLAQDLKD